MAESGVKFGTSGARGLVTALSDRIAFAYTLGFLQHLEQKGELVPGSAVAIGGDLRPSTERILGAVALAIRTRGYAVVHAGRVPSPALMLYAIKRGIPSMMVTGSHIPDDRNGIKFNGPKGEILKSDEPGILAQQVDVPAAFGADGNLPESARVPLPEVDREAERAYVKRWLDAFPHALAGRRIGVYGHSAVGRELLVEILEGLGAEVPRFGWSERFIPVDTEAIRPEDIELARGFAAGGSLFALVSTDGDSDRPLIADEHGKFMRGDVACVLAARFLGVTSVAAPVSCNTVLERSGWFRAARTRIGSPYVIEAMQAAVARGDTRVAGYEANGGFLQASDLDVPGGGVLSALPTRDPVVVQLALLCQAVARGVPLSALTRDLPPRFTDSDRLENFPTEQAARLLAGWSEGGAPAIEQSFAELGPLDTVNQTDGLRMTFKTGDVLHVRGSGNAPELRCYVEGASEARAAQLLHYGMRVLATARHAG
jgi:phosphomannomutase